MRPAQLAIFYVRHTTTTNTRYYSQTRYLQTDTTSPSLDFNSENYCRPPNSLKSQLLFSAFQRRYAGVRYSPTTLHPTSSFLRCTASL